KALAKIHRRSSPATPRTWCTRVPRHSKRGPIQADARCRPPQGRRHICSCRLRRTFKSTPTERGILKLSGRHPCLTWQKRPGATDHCSLGGRNGQSEDHVSHLIDREVGREPTGLVKSYVIAALVTLRP